MATESTPIKPLADLRKDLEKLNHQFTEAGDDRSKLEILQELVISLLYEVRKTKDANLKAEVQGLLNQINRKLNLLVPEGKVEEKKRIATILFTAAATGGDIKRGEAPKTVAEVVGGDSSSLNPLAKGTLIEAIFSPVPSEPALDPIEEDQVTEVKKQLAIITKDFKAKNKVFEELSDIFRLQGLRIAVPVGIRRQDGTTFSCLADSENIQKMCIGLRNEALEGIRFLFNKISKLLRSNQFKKAFVELEFLYPCSKEIMGIDHLETLKLQLYHSIAQCTDTVGLHQTAGILLQKTVESLEKSVSKFTGLELLEIKRCIAVGYYALAQHSLRENEFVNADVYAELSENLKKEYGASEEEIEIIRFFRAKIQLKIGDKSKAKQIIIESYNLLSAKNRLSNDLIPVLQELIFVAENENNIKEQLEFLMHLLDIKKHLKLDAMDIIRTQLKLLEISYVYMPEVERWNLLNDIESRLNKISVTGEGVLVGLCYQQLAKTRMILLPQDWSNIKKRNYHHKTLEIIYKAKMHLNANAAITHVVANLDKLRETCQKIVDSFDDLRPFVVGQPIHPEDAAEIALSAVAEDGKNVHETSTQEHLMNLSDFSSEVRHSLVDEADRVLTVAEFEDLPEEGTINPYRFRAAQGGINPEFRDGKSLQTAKQGLVDDPAYTMQVPPVEIGIYKGEVYSFDTRRLIVHQQAREENAHVVIRYKKISGPYLEGRIKAIFSPRPWKGFVTAIRHGGKGSESEPYINPTLRAQLDEKVAKEFKRFPSARKAPVYDPNGFPIIKQKAKKIYKFFKKRADNGSKNSLQIVREAERIGRTEGEYAAYDYLIQKKAELLQTTPKTDKIEEKRGQPKAVLPSETKLPNASFWVLLKGELIKKEKAEVEKDDAGFACANTKIRKLILSLEFDGNAIVSAGFTLQEALDIISAYEANIKATPKFLALKEVLNNRILSYTKPAVVASATPAANPSSGNPISDNDYTNQDMVNLLDVYLGEEWTRINIAPANLEDPAYYIMFYRAYPSNEQIILPPVTCLPESDLTQSLIDMWTNAQHHLGDAQEILIPFNSAGHWVLLQINLATRTISYLDSESDNSVEEAIISDIELFGEHISRLNGAIVFSYSFGGARRQLGNHACGVMMVENIRDIAYSLPLPGSSFSPEAVLKCHLKHRQMLHDRSLSLEELQAVTPTPKAALPQPSPKIEKKEEKKGQPKAALAAAKSVAIAPKMRTTPVVGTANNSTIALGSAAAVGVTIANIASAVTPTTSSTGGPSASRRASDKVADYVYVDDDPIPGWQRKDENLGRHK